MVIIIDEDQIVLSHNQPPTRRHRRRILSTFMLCLECASDSVTVIQGMSAFHLIFLLISVIVSNALIFYDHSLVSLNFRCLQIVDGTGVIVFIK